MYNCKFNSAETCGRESSTVVHHTEVDMENMSVDIMNMIVDLKFMESTREEKLMLMQSLAALVGSIERSSFWLAATKWFLCLLSNDYHTWIKEVIRSGVVHVFLLFLTMEGSQDLTMEQFQELQKAAAQVLICIASGSSEDIKANEAMEPPCRALVLLLHSEDEEVLKLACAAAALLSDCVNNNTNIIKLILDADLFPRLCELIKHESPTIVFCALRAIGNIINVHEHIVLKMSEDGVFCDMLRLMQHENVVIQKEACRASSCLIAVPRLTLEAMGVSLNCFIRQLVSLLGSATDSGIKEVVATAISIATSNASPKQMEFIVSCGCIMALCMHLCCKNSKILKDCLEGLENILIYGEALQNDAGVNPHAEEIYNIGGWGVLGASINYYYSSDNRKKAEYLLEEYWRIYLTEGNVKYRPVATL